MASISVSGWANSGNRTFTLTVTEQSYNSITNKSVVKWTLSVSGGNNQSMDTYIYAAVNGTAVKNQTIKATYDGGITWSGFPANVGSTSGTMEISHDSDGKKSIGFYLEGYAVTYSTRSESGSLNLTDIDRTAPTVTQNDISNIGTNSFTISATSNVACNSWEYSLNNGSSWTVFSTTSGTSASKTITGLTVNTSYTVLIRAKKTLNDVYGTSGSKTAKTTGASPITSAGDITLGNACNIQWTPYDSSFQYKLSFSLGSWSYTTGYISPASTSAYTYTGYTIPLTVANQLPNATDGTMTATLTTFNSGGTQIGTSSSKTFNVHVPASIIPSIDNVTIQEGTASGFNLYVKSLSTVKVTTTASGSYGSTITSIVVKFDNASVIANSSGVATSPVLSTAGTMQIRVLVTDSRGRTTQTPNAFTITVYDYFQPNGTLSITRNPNNITEVTATVEGSIAPVNNTNAKRLTITCKRLSDEHTTTHTVNPIDYYDFTGNHKITWTQTLSDIETESYEFTVAITDTKQTVTIKQQSAVICISRLGGGKGVTFFGEAKDEGIWIVRNNTYIELDYVIEQGTSGIWTYRKWNSGVSECWGSIVQNVTSWTQWGGLYEAKPSAQGIYPTNLFIDAPVFNLAPNDTGTGGGISGYETYTTGTKEKTPYLYGLRPSAGSNSAVIKFHCYAVGRWKS